MSEDNGLTQKSRRAFHRVISGIKKDSHNLRFLTLTSAPESPEDIQRSWHNLRARLDRRGLACDYIRVQEFTRAGRKHLHVLFRGAYIEQALLSSWWQDIHQAKIVDIRLVKFERSPRKVAAYMAKYCSKEGAGRLSWSWTWVWKGFCRDWQTWKRWWRKYYDVQGKTTFQNCINGWDALLSGRLIADFKAMLSQCRNEMQFDTTDFFPLHVAANGHTQSRPSEASGFSRLALTGVIS